MILDKRRDTFNLNAYLKVWYYIWYYCGRNLSFVCYTLFLYHIILHSGYSKFSPQNTDKVSTLFVIYRNGNGSIFVSLQPKLQFINRLINDTSCILLTDVCM